MENTYTKEQIEFIKAQRLIYTNMAYIVKAFYNKYGKSITIYTISKYCKGMLYTKKYKNQVFNEELRMQIIEHYEKGLKPAAIAEILSVGRAKPFNAQQVSNQISAMNIRERIMQPREIYREPQDYNDHMKKVEVMKRAIAIGDAIEVYRIKWDGSKSKTIEKFKVIGIYEHFVNVMIRGRVVSYYWDDIIKLYKAV